MSTKQDDFYSEEDDDDYSKEKFDTIYEENNEEASRNVTMVKLYNGKKDTSVQNTTVKFQSTDKTFDNSQVPKEKLTLDFIKKNDAFIPYVNEVGKNGKSEIESVKNIVIKEGTIGAMKKIIDNAKAKNQQINAAKVNKNSFFMV